LSVILTSLIPYCSEVLRTEVEDHVNILLNVATLAVAGYVIQVTKRLDRERRSGGQ